MLKWRKNRIQVAKELPCSARGRRTGLMKSAKRARGQTFFFENTELAPPGEAERARARRDERTRPAPRGGIGLSEVCRWADSVMVL